MSIIWIRFCMTAVLARKGKKTRIFHRPTTLTLNEKGDSTMADYFTNFSVVINLASKKQQAYALDLAYKASIAHRDEQLADDFPEALRTAIEDWQFESEAAGSGKKHGVWLHSTYGGVDSACLFIQHLLQKFDPQRYVAFQWSHDCSKPRTDAYGGGAAVITAKKIKTISTGAWLQKQTARLPASESLHT
jgi:hypothetical protein